MESTLVSWVKLRDCPPSIVFTRHQLNCSLKNLYSFCWLLITFVLYSRTFATNLMGISALCNMFVHNKFITWLLWDHAESKTPPLFSLEIIPASVYFFPSQSGVWIAVFPWHLNYLWITNNRHKLLQNPKISAKLLLINIFQFLTQESQ